MNKNSKFNIKCLYGLTWKIYLIKLNIILCFHKIFNDNRGHKINRIYVSLLMNIEFTRQNHLTMFYLMWVYWLWLYSKKKNFFLVISWNSGQYEKDQWFGYLVFVIEVKIFICLVFFIETKILYLFPPRKKT